MVKKTYTHYLFIYCSLCRQFINVPVLVNNLGLLDQLSYWKVSAPCSAAGYNLTMKKHRYDPAHNHESVTSHLYRRSHVRSTSSSVVSARNSSAPMGCWEKSVKWIRWTTPCSQSCRWVEWGELLMWRCVLALHLHSLSFMLDRKRARMSRKASVLLRHCRQTFQLLREDWKRRCGAKQKKV